MSKAPDTKVLPLQVTFDRQVHDHLSFTPHHLNVQQLFSTENTIAANRIGLPEPADDSEITLLDRKILLVEDNPINQKVALRILAQHGYKADTAANGEEALKAFEKEPYDLILMDIQMPVMDGISATKSLRDLCGPDAPYIIAVTANVTDEDRKNCFDAGMNDFITKPIRSELLAEAIKKAPPPKSSYQDDSLA